MKITTINRISSTLKSLLIKIEFLLPFSGSRNALKITLCLTQSLPKWFKQTKNVFSLHILARDLRDESSISISVEVIYLSIRFHKDSTLGNFCQMQRWLQPWWLCSWLLCSIYKVKISHHHITSHILLAKAFKYLRKMWW